MIAKLLRWCRSSEKMPAMLGCLLLVGCFIVFHSRPYAPPDGRFVQGALDNGTHFALQGGATRDHRIVVILDMRVGAQDERAEESGISHYLEHMAFNGAGDFSASDIEKWLRAQGLAVGRDMNASTDYTDTTYELRVPDNSPDAVAQAIKLLGAMAMNMHLDPAMIEKERPIVAAELRMRENPDLDAEIQVRRFSSDDRVRRDPVVGTLDRINSFTRAQLLDYYQRLYRPDRATIEVVGDVDAPQVERQIRETFAPWKAATASDQTTVATANNTPHQAGTPYLVVAGGQVTSSYLKLSRCDETNTPHQGNQVEDEVYRSLFCSLITHRLQTLEDRGELKIESADAHSFSFLRQLARTDVRLNLQPAEWRNALRWTWREMDSLRAQAVDENEWQRAQDTVRRDLRNQMDTCLAGTGEDRAEQVLTALHRQDGMADPQERLETMRNLLASITPASFQKWMEANVDDSAWRVALVESPAQASGVAPSAEDLASVVNQAKQDAPEAWHDSAVVNLDGESSHDVGQGSGTAVEQAGDTTTITLSNNVTVHYKQLAASGKQVIFSLSLAGGVDEETAGTKGVTLLAAAALESAATTECSSLQMTDWLRTHGMAWEVSTERNCVVLKLTAPASETENAFRFLHAILSKAELRPNVMARWQAETDSTLRRMTQDPLAMAGQTVNAEAHPDDIRYQEITHEDLTHLTLEAGNAWLAHLRQHCFLEMAIVGNLDTNDVTNSVARYFGSLDSHPSTIADAAKTPDYKTNYPALGLSSASQQRAAATLVFQGPSLSDYQGFTGMQLLSQVLQFRLYKELREKRGLVYFVSCSVEPGLSAHGRGTIAVMLLASRDNLHPATEACEKVLRDLLATGPSREETAYVLRQTLLELKDAKSDPDFWAGTLSQLRLNGSSLQQIQSWTDEFRDVADHGDLKRLAQQYLSGIPDVDGATTSHDLIN